MKYLSIIAANCISCFAYAGGTIGGGSGVGLTTEHMLELARIGLDLKSLPKTYVTPDDFRRTHARLSVDEALTVPLVFDGEQVQVKKLAGSIVDLRVSKEFLPQN